MAQKLDLDLAMRLAIEEKTKREQAEAKLASAMRVVEAAVLLAREYSDYNVAAVISRAEDWSNAQ